MVHLQLPPKKKRHNVTMLPAFTTKKNTRITTHTHTPAWSCVSETPLQWALCSHSWGTWSPAVHPQGTVQAHTGHLVTQDAPSGCHAGAHVVIYGAPSGRHAAAHGRGGGDLHLIRRLPPAPHCAEQLAALIERPPVPRLTVLPGHAADGQRAAPVPAELR